MFASNTSQVSGDAVFVEDVFQNWLYQGNGSTQTITNGIDLAGKGGLVWLKARDYTQSHGLFDTARGENPYLDTDLTSSPFDAGNGVVYNSNGFTNKATSYFGGSGDGNGKNYVSWTFRKQPKFFDVVTYTGNGVAGRTVAHSLGSVPGCIIVKRTDATGSWLVYHQNLLNTSYALLLNSTTGQIGSSTFWNNTAPTSTVFTVGNNTDVNASGGTYVAYVFASNAGGFGLNGTDNVISCGSFTTDASGNFTVNLGYEPQWVMLKRTSSVGEWYTFDNMRGLSATAFSGSTYSRIPLYPNLANAEGVGDGNYGILPTATGFVNDAGYAGGGNTYIYIAIRRGPMKTPTSGTSVFSPITSSASSGTALTTGFPVDLQINKYRISDSNYWVDRLRGVNTTTSANSRPYLVSNSTAAETTSTNLTNSWGNSGFLLPGYYSGASTVYWSFGRAPGFFDEVCWTGDGTGNARNHNLTVYPELVISKLRSGGAGFGAWNVQNNINPSAKQTGFLNTTAAFSSSGATSPTANVFYPTDDQSGATYVTYLFASCPGVSKCGSYTGTGTTQQINCGFTGGARFVLIKRTDSTGDWYVWDTARGIVSGNDPYLLLNSTAAEVTSTDYIDTYSAGFEISSTAPAAINASGGSFVYLAIA